MYQQLKFPAVLTYKLACDLKVVHMLKDRSLGNSVTSLRRKIQEGHTLEWLRHSLEYLSVLEQLGVPTGVLGCMRPVPRKVWFLAAFVRAVIPHLPENKARITSVVGSVLKMDSTKNVRSRQRVRVVSIAQAPPQLLYVDRDCCCATGKGKVAAMFGDWKDLMVQLDVWHLMRRFARGVTTDAHILYGPFMARLSLAIFEWDAEDRNLLRRAEQGADGGRPVTLSARELARHCRRRTRGAKETERLIQEVLDHFWEAKDTMGMALLDQARTQHIWDTQRQHMACIQDPPGLPIYTKVGEVTRGGIKLPIFKCVSGSTSLECFHLHQCRFIPGLPAGGLDPVERGPSQGSRGGGPLDDLDTLLQLPPAQRFPKADAEAAETHGGGKLHYTGGVHRGAHRLGLPVRLDRRRAPSGPRS
ncbi:uncharacterized protein LOC133488233 [Phyllopteryx taeniolatus]|uniref:uncharacterized protein LOC133488233 n=1 Tax=Phyllopteryx taeniolatus TaxID=161469 RepID=UPI002AD278EF|nr:uncharacterized protein LOC133488233 [Phyllopteryx taeniolatus]